MNDLAVPFKIKNLYEGLAESDGLISFSNGILKIQFQIKDSIIGFVKGKINEYEIPTQKIQKIELIKKLWGNKLIISINDLQFQLNIPNQDSSEISLSIEKKNLDLADRLVANVNYEISTQSEQNEFEQELRQDDSNK